MDVITFGETMTLFVSQSIGPLRFANNFEKTIGGAESNLAIALSRLGHDVSWFSRLGDDEFGKYVRNFIRGEGVDTSHVIFDKDLPTAVFFKERQAYKEPKIYYYRRGSAASRLSPNDLDESYIAKAKFLHITGITPALGPSCLDTVHAAMDIAKKHNVTICFDPNVRLKLWTKEEAKETLLPIALRSDIVLPGLDEGELLTGATDAENIAKYFLERGCQAVVVKLGQAGAYFLHGTESGFVKAFPVQQIVDPIGAGDAFAAGFLSGLLQGWSYKESVLFANRMGAYALGVVGDVEGLPYLDQILRSDDEVSR
jgi:2-dehydro-3-deoxygluconokinase